MFDKVVPNYLHNSSLIFFHFLEFVTSPHHFPRQSSTPTPPSHDETKGQGLFWTHGARLHIRIVVLFQATLMEPGITVCTEPLIVLGWRVNLPATAR